MNLFFALITSSLVGGILYILLLLIHPLTQKIFSKTWHYYSLVIPLIFLLGGTYIVGSVTGLLTHYSPNNTPLIHTSEWIPAMYKNMIFEFNMPPMIDSGIPNEDLLVNRASELVLENETGTISISSLSNLLRGYIERVLPFLLTIWALGAILFLFISAKNYYNYRRVVLFEAQNITNYDCIVPIVVSNFAHTPMLLGLIKPVIVLPNMELSNAEIEVILAHEVMHYKRKDLWFKVIALLANAIHWFNPAVYAFNRQLGTTCELSCDEKVALKMNPQRRRFYGETILQILQYNADLENSTSNIALATNLCNSKKDVKRRLISMMKARKMKKSIMALALATGMLIVGGGFFISNVLGSPIPIETELVYASAPAMTTVMNTSAPSTNVSPIAESSSNITTTVQNSPREGFVTPTLTVEVLDRLDRQTPSANALSAEEAAIIGAQYIWEVFGISIDGSFVAMNYWDWDSHNRTYWHGNVSNSAANFFGQIERSFGFQIDAVTGEWINISHFTNFRDTMASEARDRFNALTRTDEGWAWYNEAVNAVNADLNAPEPLDEYIQAVMEYTSRHFINTEVVNVEFISIRASQFSFDENDNLISVANVLRFTATDSTGRTADVLIDEQTRAVAMIATEHNDILPEFLVDNGWNSVVIR